MDELIPQDALSTQFGIIPAPRDLESRGDWEKFRAELKSRIEDLLENDFNRLQSILYVMDVDETKASAAFATRDQQAVAAELADLMIARHIARMETRRTRG